MKKTIKKPLIILSSILVIIVGTILLTPYILQLVSRPNNNNAEYSYKEEFLTDYDEIRNRFLSYKEEFTHTYTGIITNTYPVNIKDNLFIDELYIPAQEKKENLIILTAGVHGIEGYIGSTMIEVFVREILPTLNVNNTGILLVNNINPYGVKYGRRFNENNVDLNRNMILDWKNFDLSSNKDYPQVQDFFEKDSSIGNMTLHEIGFFSELAITALTDGVSTVTNALLTGQYEYPDGVYYGGTKDEFSTKVLKNIFTKALNYNYTNTIHFDLHSGYGPSDKMVIFNSHYDTITEQDAKILYNYDTILAHDSEDFYPTIGDTNSFFYKLAESSHATTNLYSTCFEFGTLGDSLFAGILSMHYTIDENRNFHNPTKSKTTQKIIEQRYLEMFLPSSPEWRQNAIDSYITATKNVLAVKLLP